MGFELRMPKLGESVTEGTIGKWLKQPGEQVTKYDLLVEVQTDKVNTEIPSEVDGTLSEIKVQEGETVAVGTVLAIFETAGGATQAQPAEAKADAKAEAKPAEAGAAAAAQNAGDGNATAAPAAAEAPAPTATGEATAQTASAKAAPAAAQTAPARSRQSDGAEGNGKTATGADVRATPAVRKLAAEHGIDLSRVQGTGLGGRVSRQDIEAFIAQGAEAPAAGDDGASRPESAAAAKPAPLQGDTPVPLTQMRRAIAANMVQAWSAPHAHAAMEVDMTNLMRLRETARADFQKREGFDLSPAAFIVKAAVEALAAVASVNSSWTDQGLVMRKAINVGYAVALGDEGLVVPVIRDADGKSITGLMRAIRDVVDRAKAKKLTLDDFQGGTFTVNNTGPLGTFVSSPIVPPGQAAIVSAEAIRKRLVVMEDDSIAIRSMMNLVIGFDHRAIDGSTAARFLATMRQWLEGITGAVSL